jgi:choline dehydrogenase
MGVDTDSVVDLASMSVHRLKDLYVADASAMPNVTRGNLQAPVILLAERAAPRIARQARR